METLYHIWGEVIRLRIILEKVLERTLDEEEREEVYLEIETEVGDGRWNG